LKKSKIQRIKEAEKIAAGEVVERPANIVKELVENSIDAEAKEIRVIVRRAGKNLIQIIDNGIGIPPDEIEFAFERHTSSKIHSIEDLDTLSTLGFRGEALASIAAVCKVEIISRTAENEHGIQLFIEGGKLTKRNEINCPIGTNIKVNNIFYNIPARQKFLKSDPTELGHITDIIQRYSLANPELHFIYQHNDLNILNCPASNDLKTTGFHIYGKQTAKFLEPINFSEEAELFNLHGLLGHPKISKKNRNVSSLFLNKRYIISDLLHRAIQEAYKGTLMVNKHPFFILFIELNPSSVDFNIHPKKLHVRFEKDEFMYNKVYNVVRKFVEDLFIAKEAKYISTDLKKFIPKSDLESINDNALILDEELLQIGENGKIKRISESIGSNEEKISNDKEVGFIEEPVQITLDEDKVARGGTNIKVSESIIREKYIISENFPKIKLISHTGQLSNNVYVVLEGINEDNEEGLFILDQHAASERITKEYFLDLYEKSKVVKQSLISPLKIELSPSEKIFLLENLNKVKKLGFDFDHFGGNTFILRGIPTIMGKLPKIEIIKEIIGDITDIGKDRSFSEVKEEIINYLSCHKSIRGGDDLTLKEVRNLIIELANCNDSYHCAHGRPTMRFISFKELDKLFKRTG
jgi:DNA mismatch repair protein MutL